MRTAYHPAFGERVSYSFVNLPDSADGQVRETCNEVIRLIRHDAIFSPLVREDAQHYLKAGQGNAIEGTWKMREKMRFQNDEKTAAETDIQDPRLADVIEVLIRPHDQAQLIRLRDIGFEDCDGYAMYAGCILTALGIPVALVTVAADAEAPDRYSHVYLAAYPDGPDGRRIPLDFSHGKHIGWECPNFGRKKEWPVWVTPSESFWRCAGPVAAIFGAYFGISYLARAA